ncbi:hypothetical protein AALC17_11655 [Oscillospiraceae bacterium 38-13]
MEEFVQCFNGREELRVLNLHGPGLSTAAERRAALRYDAGNMNLILVNYESAGGVLEDLLPLVRSQSLLVFDEVRMVKKVGGEYASAAPPRRKRRRSTTGSSPSSAGPPRSIWRFPRPCRIRFSPVPPAERKTGCCSSGWTSGISAACWTEASRKRTMASAAARRSGV